jgi:hypothetical protein
MGMDFLEVVGDRFVRDMPFAIIARRHFGVTLRAEKRSAVEELFQTYSLRPGCGVDIER